LFAPSAISQWDVLEGAQIALSTLTGLAALANLLEVRQAKQIEFRVFPFEAIERDSNVVVEVYPALFPITEHPNPQARDALRIVQWMKAKCLDESIRCRLSIPKAACIYGRSSKDAIREEGWILGVGE
jgi:hypothetical protein